jgi:hypothetical protein
VSSINDLELDTSAVCVKLSIKNTDRTAKIDLDKKINVEEVKAKMLKKESKLRVVLPY